jgi:hypothetical protein
MLSFATLWANHPSTQVPANNAPCRSKAGAPYYENQCAIRLGVALSGAGVSLSSFTGPFCWHKHGRSHPLRANDLAHWLDSSSVHFVKKAEIARRTAAQKISVANYAGRTGIVMWMNFWGAGNRGDHIDLWNGVRIAHGDLDYFARSEEVRFWAIS